MTVIRWEDSPPIQLGKLAAFRPARAFEAVQRTVGCYRVYARYIGEAS